MLLKKLLKMAFIPHTRPGGFTTIYRGLLDCHTLDVVGVSSTAVDNFADFSTG